MDEATFSAWLAEDLERHLAWMRQVCRLREASPDSEVNLLRSAQEAIECLTGYAESNGIDCTPLLRLRPVQPHSSDEWEAARVLVDRLIAVARAAITAFGFGDSSGGEQTKPPIPPAFSPGRPDVSRPQLAEAAVIAHFKAHPDSDPTADEIAASLGPDNLIDGATVRNTPTWKAHRKGKKKSAEDAGDGADFGDVDHDLEVLAGHQERGRDRRKLRRRV